MKQSTKKTNWTGWFVTLIIIALMATAAYFYYNPATVIEVQREVVEKVVEKNLTWEEQLAVANAKKQAEIEEIEQTKKKLREEYEAKVNVLDGRLEEIRAVELSLR